MSVTATDSIVAIVRTSFPTSCTILPHVEYSFTLKMNVISSLNKLVPARLHSVTAEDCNLRIFKMACFQDFLYFI
jgi:hypothetical protein